MIGVSGKNGLKSIFLDNIFGLLIKDIFGYLTIAKNIIMVPIIIRTEEEDMQYGLMIDQTAIRLYEQEKKLNYQESERRLLLDLIGERFPDYNSKHYLNKIKAAIKKGEFGAFDRFNNYLASYDEVKEFFLGK